MPLNLNNLPDSPGIYLFYDKQGLVYVGKATSLKNRVKSYFKIGRKTPRPIEMMIHEIVNIEYKVTDSVLEAILLEGEYIKKYLPKYNVAWKDDKSWNYIVITKDNYPKVLTLRAHDRKNLAQIDEQKMYSHIFGPYPGLKTKEMMNILRRLFYISECLPRHSSKAKSGEPSAKRPCLYYQMGQCLGVCVGEISVRDYKQKVINPLIMFLRGKKKMLIKNLEKRMNLNARQNEFEEAGRVRDQIAALQKIQDIALLNKSFFEESERKKSVRIEGYDISNLGATDKVGSMVVFDEIGPVKRDYRKFNIKSVEGQSDVDCLDEVLTRRLKHNEWPKPNVFLIDGGKPQINRTLQVLRKFNINIPVVGIAKGPKRDKNQFILSSKQADFVSWVQKNKFLLIQVRDEAHRFAINFNRSKRKI